MKELGSCTIFDRTPADKILERIRDVPIIITNKTFITEQIIENAPGLEYIGLLSTGTNAVDLKSCAKKGITVTNAPAYSSASVAQLVFAFILNYCQRVADHSRGVFEGKWSQCADFCYWDFPLVELDGKILGIIGLGSIGSLVAKIGMAFNMRIIASRNSPGLTNPLNVQILHNEEVFKTADFVSLHCPLTPATKQIVNKHTLSTMKKNAFLINTGRGDLVNENDLAYALQNGVIAGAGLDVTSQEPLPSNSPLLGAPRCWITPHLGWGTTAARQRLINIVVENVRSYLSGKPINKVI